jgi:hypothetical protein
MLRKRLATYVFGPKGLAYRTLCSAEPVDWAEAEMAFLSNFNLEYRMMRTN